MIVGCGRYDAPMVMAVVGDVTDVMPAVALTRVLNAVSYRSADDRALRAAHERTGNRADDRALGTALGLAPFTLRHHG